MAKLRKLRMKPSELCTDEVFLRRVTLDIIGLLPTRDEYDAFMADSNPMKRAAKIDELLERKEFAEIWAMKWAELLMVKTIPNRVEYKPMFLYSHWLTRQIANNVPLDEMVQELLGASGGTFVSPAVNFYQIEETTLKTAENVAQVFLGMRLQCAQCHNHPFDRWTMDDYYSFAAFFAQIGRKTGEDYRETIVFNARGGEATHPVDGRVMKPKFLGGVEPDTDGQGSPGRAGRVAGLAGESVLRHERRQPRLGPLLRHRHRRAGRRRPRQQPAEQPRAARRARREAHRVQVRLAAAGARHLQSPTRTSGRRRPTRSNADDKRNFAHAQVRRIPAEVLLDCICQVTETQEKFPGLPLGARAVQIADGGTSTYFLTTFGRAPRNTVCACEVKTEPTLSQALHLLNGVGRA